MNTKFFRVLATLLIVFPTIALFFPMISVSADSVTIFPVSNHTQTGSTNGSPVSVLEIKDQSGSDDDPAKYLSFNTPSNPYTGYQKLFLPSSIQRSWANRLTVKINYKGPLKTSQTWAWSLYDWSMAKWISIGDNAGATAGTWSQFRFSVTFAQRFIRSTTGEIRLQIKSNNSTGNAKIDYESISIAYTIPPTPTPTSPPIAWPNLSTSLYKSGFVSPVFLTHAGDGSGRLFVVEQCGTIKIIQSGAILSTPFLDISSLVLCGGEQGLLSMAFPPNYTSTGHFYVYYTNLSGNNVVARISLTADANVADASSLETVMTINHPTYTNHNGGQLAFGSDGHLYIGTGDGGSRGDPNNNAQNTNSLLGKILRIDVETGDPATYTVPADNPFVSMPGYRSEIWALGLRNPWRFSFDRGTGDLFIGDVGQNTYEEVDFENVSSPGGANYGWRILEGNHCYNPSTGCVKPSGYTAPATEYQHGTDDSIGCSITGGYVYRGTEYPSMQGFYYFGDYCTGRIWAMIRSGGWKKSQRLDTAFNISTFGEDEAGILYFADIGLGNIYKITSP